MYIHKILFLAWGKLIKCKNAEIAPLIMRANNKAFPVPLQALRSYFIIIGFCFVTMK